MTTTKLTTQTKTNNKNNNAFKEKIT